MDKILVHLNSISKTYGNVIKTKVLFDISLDIPRGQFLALIGPSGSGKSTLLNILAALDRPTSGSIIVDNQNLNQLNEDQLAAFRNKFLGFVFQFHYLLPEFNAIENVLLPYWIGRGKPNQQILEKAHKLIERVGLTDQAKKRINLLSGGQQQRVAIARALLNQPQLILADEPTGALDTKSGEQVLDLMQEINNENNTTFIVVTHDRNVALRAQRIIELIDGRICKDFYPRDLGKEKAREILESHACVWDEPPQGSMGGKENSSVTK